MTASSFERRCRTPLRTPPRRYFTTNRTSLIPTATGNTKIMFPEKAASDIKPMSTLVQPASRYDVNKDGKKIIKKATAACFQKIPMP